MSTLEATHTLFVVPRGEDNGFQARVGGHVLDLIDPASYSLAPNADDLFVVSLAAVLAWSARDFLRAHDLPDYVSVSAEWQKAEDPHGRDEINLKVSVSERVEEMRETVAAAFEKSLAARSLAQPVVHISFEGAGS